ncbi:MAG: aldehyde dehydrogenase family protein [Gammaproteobacteria bacterium]|nr:aldehyde dehydrogenase family protein [Gammaproteobacteria bacterium]
MASILKVVSNENPPAVSLTVMQQVLHRQQRRAQELLNANRRAHQRRLNQFQHALKKHQTALTEAVHADIKAHSAEVAVVEWAPIFGALKEAQQLTKQWHKKPRIQRWFSQTPTVRHLGRGCCLVVCAWQQPLAQPLIHCIAALAAGNTVVLKPSHKTPNVARALAHMIELELDPADVAIFLGDARIASGLLSLKFDYSYVCGHNAALQHIQGQWKNAADKLHMQALRPVVGIVDTSADPEQAAKQIAWSRYRYSGQTDSGPHVLLVHEGLRHRFINELKQAGETLYGQTLGRQRYNKAYARLRDNEQFEQIRKLFIEARDHGAKDTIGGHFFQRDFFISPSVLVDVLDSAKIVKTPSSGPVLPVLVYDSPQRLDTLLNQFGHVHCINAYTRNAEELMQQVGNHSDEVLVNPSHSQTAHNLIAPMTTLLERFSVRQPVQPRRKQWFEKLRPPWQERKLEWLQRWLRRLSQ